MKTRLLLIIAAVVMAVPAIAKDPPAVDQDPIITPAETGRYHITSATVDVPGETAAVHLLVKFDTVTGRTWVLDTRTNSITWRELK